MNRVISTCLLALAVLQGVIPADCCVMKLAGMCRCDDFVASAETGACCHANGSAHADADHRGSSTGDHRKPCCAYMPANGLTAHAPQIPISDTFRDCVPTAFEALASASYLRSVRCGCTPRGHDSPQPYDTPLYLRVHSFLV